MLIWNFRRGGGACAPVETKSLVPYPAGVVPDLTTYDVILVNSSAGKDSAVALDRICAEARGLGIRDRVTCVHADLRQSEWPGVVGLARRQAARYPVDFRVVRNTRWDDLLAYVRARGLWPSSQARYCTSDFKRGPVRTLITELVARFHGGNHRRIARPCRVLNVLGMRADESTARAKLPPYAFDRRASNARRTVDQYLPLFAWTGTEVWAYIHRAGLEMHPAYALGMPRLSCILCILAPRAALVLGARANPAVLNEYLAVERATGHKFRQDLSIADVAAAVAAGEAAETIPDWSM